METQRHPTVIVSAPRRLSRSTVLALFERELAYYRADAPFLSVEKAAQRCLRLSALLAAARVSSRNLDEIDETALH